MLGSTEKIVSPSRTYVALCNKGNFDGHYFRKFTLPATLAEVPQYAQDLFVVHQIVSDGKVKKPEGSSGRNDCAVASWYFLNVLNFSACIDGCVTFEDYSNLKDQVDLATKIETEVKIAIGLAEAVCPSN